ncbi:MAG: CapA family protein, partial [Gemmatimonadales bacterium]
HVLSGIEFWRGRPINYSMGNFLTYRGFSITGYKGITAVLHLELGPHGRFLAGRLVPLRQWPRQGPRLDSAGAAIRLVGRMSRLDFPGTGAVFTRDGSFRPRAAARHHTTD